MGVLTFEQFLPTAAAEGEAIDTLFEERLFELVGVLHKIAHALSERAISCALIGGLAVLIQKVKEAASHGFRFRQAEGVDTLLYGNTERARNAVHLFFSGEMADRNQAIANPPLAPELKSIHGGELMVIFVGDLLRMKLSSFRDKDRVHVRSMDAAGLITPDVEAKLPAELLKRLWHARETE